MRGALMWIGWVSGSTLLQGTSVILGVFIFNGTSGRAHTPQGNCRREHAPRLGLEKGLHHVTAMIAVSVYVGNSAEAKKVPVTKPDLENKNKDGHTSKCDKRDQGGLQDGKYAVFLCSCNPMYFLSGTFAHLFSDFPDTEADKSPECLVDLAIQHGAQVQCGYGEELLVQARGTGILVKCWELTP
eukprot:1140285-Pelagomonas_calceolata.AAC.1